MEIYLRQKDVLFLLRFLCSITSRRFSCFVFCCCFSVVLFNTQWRSRGYCHPGPNIYIQKGPVLSQFYRPWCKLTVNLPGPTEIVPDWAPHLQRPALPVNMPTRIPTPPPHPPPPPLHLWSATINTGSSSTSTD